MTAYTSSRAGRGTSGFAVNCFIFKRIDIKPTRTLIISMTKNVFQIVFVNICFLKTKANKPIMVMATNIIEAKLINKFPSVIVAISLGRVIMVPMAIIQK